MGKIDFCDTASIESASSLRGVHASARGLKEAAFSNFLQQLDPWLKSYNEWYVEAAGISSGRNLQLVYGHSFLLSDITEERGVSDLGTFLSSVSSYGLSAGVSLSSNMFAVFGEGLFGCIRAGTLRQLRISHSGVADSVLEGAVQNLIHTYQQEGIVPMMVGDYEFWNRVILQTKILDRTAFTIVPKSLNPAVRRNCHGRIACFIEPDGNIYPCMNMLGNESARIGNLFELPAFAGGFPLFIGEIPQWKSVSPFPEKIYSHQERAKATMCHEHNMSIAAANRK